MLRADLLLVGLHVVYVNTTLLDHRRFSLGWEGGISELFQYLKALCVVAAFLLLGSRGTRRGYLALAAVFAFVLLDDAAQVHERLGRAAAARWELAPVLGMRGQDVGELLVYAVVGTTTLSLLAAAYHRGDAPFRASLRWMLLLLALLALFGGAMDMLHSMAAGRLRGVLGVVEDGGEMVVLSVSAWYACVLCRDGLAWRRTASAAGTA